MGKARDGLLALCFYVAPQQLQCEHAELHGIDPMAWAGSRSAVSLQLCELIRVKEAQLLAVFSFQSLALVI